MAKVDATRNYGARVELVGAGFDESVAAARECVDSSGATFVHAFEDERVIAGQGTIALELVEQLPDFGTLVVPIGGGGLAAGIAIGLQALRPERADRRRPGREHAARSPAAPSISYTIAEGIAVKQPGTLTSAILGELLDEVVTVTDEQISHAIVLLLERTKLLVEGAGAAPVARSARGQGARARTRRCVILSGGNIDPTLLIQVMRHGLTQAGRFLVVRTRFGDRPGELVKLLAARRRGARERRLRRAPPRGDGAPDRPDRGRVDARDARRGSLRRAPRHPRRAGLPGRAASASRAAARASRKRLVFQKHKPPRRRARPARRGGGRGCSRTPGRGRRRWCSRPP